MPTITKEKPSTAGAAAVDLAALDHLNNHPALLPMFARRAALRTRLEAVRTEHTTWRRAASTTHQGDDFATSATWREAQDALARLEREGATLEAEIRTLQQDIEAVQATVKAELLPTLVADGLTVETRVLALCEQLAAALAAHEAYGARCQRLYGGRLAQMRYPLHVLTQWVTLARRDCERLERLSGAHIKEE